MEMQDEQNSYNKISHGFTREKAEFTCNAWHLLQHKILETILESVVYINQDQKK